MRTSRKRRVLTRRVTEGSQGVNWNDTSCQLTPGKSDIVFNPRESSTPVVTTATLIDELETI